MTKQKTRKVRGPNKRPSMVHVTLRISREAAEFYGVQRRPTVFMRGVLEDYVKQNNDE